MKRISVLEAATILTTHAGVSFLTFEATTIPGNIRQKNVVDGVKTFNRYYKNVRKVATVNIMTGFDYGKRIDKVRAAEGLDSREIGAPVNGMTKIPGTPFAASKSGHLCLWCEIRAVVKKRFETLDGTPVDEAELKPFMPERTTEIAYCTYGLENITTITTGGETYSIDSTTYADAEATILENIGWGEPTPA
jgi:hypothetical protein